MNKIWSLLFLFCCLGCVPQTSNQPSQGGDVDAGEEGDITENDVEEEEGEEGEGGEGWEWVEVEGSACGNGSTAGIGINEGSDPSTLVLFFAGGGACWDGASCYIFNGAVNIEVNYGEEHFLREIPAVEGAGVISRDEGLFAEATWVYVPYCTADLHSGDSVGSYDVFNPNRKIHHKGAVNVEAYLEHLSESYTEVEEVFVIGLSAGGYGAMINHHRIRGAFVGAPVHVLADGAPMIQPRDGRWGMWKSAWAMEFPPDCQACDEQFSNWAAHTVSQNTDSRFALLSWHGDMVIGLYFSYQYGLETAITSLIDEVYPGAPGSQAAAFHKEGTEHVMLQFYDSLTDDDDNSLRDFVQAWAEGE